MQLLFIKSIYFVCFFHLFILSLYYNKKENITLKTNYMDALTIILIVLSAIVYVKVFFFLISEFKNIISNGKKIS